VQDTLRSVDRPTIPQRFVEPINAHLLGNLLDIPDYPVIMWIVGRPGMGKTWQLRRHLELLGFETLSVSAADLESKYAGEPAKLIQNRYLKAGRLIANGQPSALVIDDIDTTVGEWEKNTGTVNHQEILAFLMHVADRPTSIELVGAVRRVPIFFTGNDANRLYAPLTRHGRTFTFHWSPEPDEKIAVVAALLGPSGLATAEVLVTEYPEQPISFFSQLIVSSAVERVSSSAASNASFRALLRSDGKHAEQLQQEIATARLNTDWLAAARRLTSGPLPQPGQTRRRRPPGTSQRRTRRTRP